MLLVINKYYIYQILLLYNGILYERVISLVVLVGVIVVVGYTNK